MSTDELIEVIDIIPSEINESDKSSESSESITIREFPSRHNYKWSHNETEQLYREFELKQYSISKIAYLHNRTHDAILYRLKLEKLIDEEFFINYKKNIHTIMENYREYVLKYRNECHDEDYEDEEDEDEDYEEDEDDEEEEYKYDDYNDEEEDEVEFENYVANQMDKLLFIYYNTLNTTFEYIGGVITNVSNKIYNYCSKQYV
jgi:hypothetical protein